MVAALTLIHVALSLVGIGAGFVVLYGFFAAKRLDGWTAIFLATTVATSVTGFFFPVDHFMPSHALGILSLLALAIAVPARYTFRLAGAWRWLYVVGAVGAQWMNVFVLVAQLFQKTPALKALAPTQSEPPFLLTELVVMTIFIVLGGFSVKLFHAGAPIDLDRAPLPGESAGSGDAAS
jgi:hypothetical protein